MKKGIKRGVISLIVALLLLVPFSFCFSSSAFAETGDHEWAIDWVDQSQIAAYYHFAYRGFDYEGTVDASSDASTSVILYRNVLYPVYYDTYVPKGAYYSTDRIGLASSQTFVFSAIYRGTTPGITPYIYTASSSYSAPTVTTHYYALGANFYVRTWVFTTTSTTYFSFDCVDTSTNLYVSPVYSGLLSSMPDDLYQIAYGFSRSVSVTASDSTTHSLLEDGNSDSQSSSDSLDTASSSFSSAASDMDSIESGYNDDLNEQLTNIDFSDPFESESSLLSSSSFVITIFNNLIADNPLTLLIIIVSIVYVAIRIFGG